MKKVLPAALFLFLLPVFFACEDDEDIPQSMVEDLLQVIDEEQIEALNVCNLTTGACFSPSPDYSFRGDNWLSFDNNLYNLYQVQYIDIRNWDNYLTMVLYYDYY